MRLATCIGTASKADACCLYWAADAYTAAALACRCPCIGWLNAADHISARACPPSPNRHSGRGGLSQINTPTRPNRHKKYKRSLKNDKFAVNAQMPKLSAAAADARCEPRGVVPHGRPAAPSGRPRPIGCAMTVPGGQLLQPGQQLLRRGAVSSIKAHALGDEVANLLQGGRARTQGELLPVRARGHVPHSVGSVASAAPASADTGVRATAASGRRAEGAGMRVGTAWPRGARWALSSTPECSPCHPAAAAATTMIACCRPYLRALVWHVWCPHRAALRALACRQSNRGAPWFGTHAREALLAPARPAHAAAARWKAGNVPTRTDLP